MMLCCAGAGMRLHAQPLNKGRIAILGDSIAYAGHWANEVENTLRDDKKFAASQRDGSRVERIWPCGRQIPPSMPA